jgi:iron complex outermembrane receptor protein
MNTKQLPGVLILVAGLCFCFQGIYGQYKEIRGRVIDYKDGSALSNVSVVPKGSTAGSQTNSEGNFSINVPVSVNTLIFSSVGYLTREIDISNRNNIEVDLVFSATLLNEVVVIGYGSVKKRDLTGAVGSVSEKDFNKGIFAAPDQLIQGKVAGVQIMYNNGEPGGAATIKIRGNSALIGTGQPLYVIDGIPLDGRTLQAGVNPMDGSFVQTGINPLNFMNPEDIASIDVLKDASATAIYGSRAAYGVVMINTKKAQAGKAKLDVSIVTGVSSILKKIKVLTPSQFREAIKYYGVSDSLDKGRNVDAMDIILRNAIQQNYNLAITGGNETGKYRISFNLLNQDGIIIQTGFKKYGVNLSTNFKFLDSKKLGLDVNVSSSQSIQNLPGASFGAPVLVVPALTWNPTDRLKNADGSINVGTKDHPNPITILEKFKDNFKLTNILASIAPSYKFNSWLDYKLLLSVNYSSGITRSSVKKDIFEPGGGSASISNTELTTRQITNTVNFNKKILSDLRLDAVAGFEFIDFTMKGSTLTGQGQGVGGFGNYGLDYTNYVQFSQNNNRSISSFIDPISKLQSYFGRTIFNYKNKYLLTGTFRVDGSTKFGENNKYGYFPSFAASWIISEEKFFKLDFINSLKFRGGWGITGNQEFPSGASQSKYSFRDNGIIIQVNNPNPDLKWQSDRQYNIGFDFSVLNNRISGTLDYFNKSTSNLLFPGPPIQPAPPSSVVRWTNLNGNIINKGIEVKINGNIISHEKSSWELSLNATFLKNSVMGIPSPILTGWAGSATTQIIKNNLPMQTFYTRKFLGFDKATGLSFYQDEGTVLYAVGNPNPKILLGMSSTFSYKKFSIVANINGAFGQDIYNATLQYALSVRNIQYGGNIAQSVFRQPIRESFANPSQSPSSRFIEKGDYLKMANITVSYELGEVAKAFKRMNIYVTCQNLFLITKYSGFDPETNSITTVNNTNTDVPSLGIDWPHYPSSRTISLGINFSL